MGEDDISMCRETAGWEITFEDTFDGSVLNTTTWTARDNMTHGNTEKQLYVASAIKVSNGNLIITTDKQKAVSPTGVIYNFTSGWLDTQDLVFQALGRFEVRTKLPSFKVGRTGKWPTAWPAHWLMPQPSTSVPPNVCWPVGGEIDIMEAYTPASSSSSSSSSPPLAAAPNEQVTMTYHWATECNHDLWTGQQGRVALPGNDWSDTWHTFGIEWTKTSILWYIDGILHYNTTANTPPGLFIPQEPFYMILNTALQPWADASLDTNLPALHFIDRVTWCTATNLK